MNVYLTQQAESDPGVIPELRDRKHAAELVATALEHFDLFSGSSDRDNVSVEEFITGEPGNWQTRDDGR